MNATNDGFIDHSAAYAAQHEAWEDSSVMREALRQSLSPKAIATIAVHLRRATGSNDDQANREVAWFTKQLVKMLGGNEQHSRLAEELGL